MSINKVKRIDLLVIGIPYYQRASLGRHAFNRTPSSWKLLCMTLGIIASNLGCNNPTMVPVTGHVSFDGEPITNGNIRFCPLDGTPGIGAATKIIDGKYTIPPEPGMPIGSYMILVSATKEVNRSIPRPEIVNGESKMHKPVKQYIPPKYLSRSELKVEIIPGPNQHDLKLTSD